jgi:hypothetical protein
MRRGVIFCIKCFTPDPLVLSPPKSIQKIGENLQSQYERWQPRARYKQSLDPTSEEVKKLCTSLRRNAKEERVLFHYNGHGVPKPTSNGEIWVFNRVSRPPSRHFPSFSDFFCRLTPNTFRYRYTISKRGWGRHLYTFTTARTRGSSSSRSLTSRANMKTSTNRR